LLWFQIGKWIEAVSREAVALGPQGFRGGKFWFSLKAGGHLIALRRSFAKAASSLIIPEP
jgi:hypothetical protein